MHGIYVAPPRARISAPHAPVPLASGESLEGRIDLGLMRISDTPRNEDLLLRGAIAVERTASGDSAG